MSGLSRLLNLLQLPFRGLAKALDALDRFWVEAGGAAWRRCQPAWRALAEWVVPIATRVASEILARTETLRRVLGPPVKRTAERIPLQARLWALCILTSGILALFWAKGAQGFRLFVGFTDAQYDILAAHSVRAALFEALPRAGGAFAVIAFAAAVFSFVRSRISLWLLKATAAAYTVLTCFVLWTMWTAPSVLNSIDDEFFPVGAMQELWVRDTRRMVPFVLFAVILLVVVVLRKVSNHFRRETVPNPALGDRIVTNLKTHGEDPRFRKSIYWSALAHLLCVILPMLALRGCMTPYGVPKGSGQPVLQMVRIKKLKKKPEKKYVVNLNTAISFYVPKIDESEIFDEVDKLTEDTYEAQQVGKLGAGGGTKGGWPNGMEDAKVRFIRLEYSGGDWDQDMGYGADYNMLLAFNEMTGFNIWPRTESISIRQLKRFPRHRAPPFVYLTGGLEGRINVSQAEIKILRDYCLKMGGMIFADNGGGNFDRSFRLLMRRTFPELPIVEIPFDDVIFQQPFFFPRGAPPLWHHSGNTAQGIKYHGRWIVFYHQGDINDAWKDGHSDAPHGVVMQAYKMGVNVIAYSFNQYMQINFGGEVPK